MDWSAGKVGELMPEPLTATTITRGETTFQIRKLLPEAQFEVFERHVRPNLGKIIEAIGGDVAKVLKTAIPLFDQIRNRTEPMSGGDLLEMLDEGSVAGVLSAIGKALSGLPPDDLMALRDRLFDQVYFTSKMSPKGQKVGAALGTAFYQMPFTAHLRTAGEGSRLQFRRLLVRHRVPSGYGGRPGFEPARFSNVEPFFAHPMDAGMCTVADLRARDADGEPVLDIADVADMNERLIVQAENRKRADDAARRKSDSCSKGPKRRP